MKKILWLFLISLLVSTAGAQWQKQTIDTKASLRGLSVVSQDVIWASGTGGTFLRTVDGGKNWTVGKVPGAEKLDFRDVEAFDAKTAYLLSIGNGETSRIYKTTDGGTSWQKQFQADDNDIFLDAFAFWDKDHGIAMGDPVKGYYFLLRTDNGGKKWYPLSTDKMIPAKPGEAAFAASGTCIITRGKKDVFMISGGTDARVFYSKNRGLSWTVSESRLLGGKPSQGAFSIAFANRRDGIIVGGDYANPEDRSGNISFTQDGGKQWGTRKKENQFGYRSGAAFIDKRTIMIVGSNGSDISTNGGFFWQSIDRENYNSVQAKGRNAIWAVGANGLVSRYLMTGIL